MLSGNWLALSAQTNDAQILEWPNAKFPMIAGWLGLEGYCDVRFSVDEEGYPFAVTPSCTRRIFCFEAKRAVSESRFDPARVNGIPRIRTNLVFPLTFAFERSPYDEDQDPRPLELCEQKADS
ncbi:MAG: energy transducer TonB [Henriciella sp.]